MFCNIAIEVAVLYNFSHFLFVVTSSWKHNEF